MKTRLFVQKPIILLVLLLLLAAPLQASAGGSTETLYSTTAAAGKAAFTTPTAVVATGALNVRSGPGVGYSRVAVVYQGQTVNLLGRNADGSWVKVGLYNGIEGWVNAGLIQPSVPISTLAVLVSTSTAHVATGALNVRSGPGVTYSTVAVARNGDALILLGRNSDASWIKVRLASGTEGWVNAGLIQTSIALASLPVLDSGASPTQPAATVATGALNIRSGPGIGYGVIATLTQGQPVVLLGRTANTGWAQIRIYNGAVGWANAAYLNSNVPFSSLPVVSSTPPAPAPGPAPTGAVGTVVASALNVRYGPGLGYNVITGVYWGQQLSLIGRSLDGAWLKVVVPGGVGWVSSYYVQTNVPFFTLPVVY